MIRWINVNTRLPKCCVKFGDSDYCLCKDVDNNQTPFVAWYNNKENKWTVSHHFATSGNVPVTHYITMDKIEYLIYNSQKNKKNDKRTI